MGTSGGAGGCGQAEGVEEQGDEEGAAKWKGTSSWKDWFHHQDTNLYCHLTSISWSV